jgi:predicted dehydrogenase
MSDKITRRQFTLGAAAIGAGLVGRSPALGALGANERVGLGFIGTGNRGDQLIDGFKPHKDAAFVALCDVYTPYLAAANAKVGGKAVECGDYRKLLERKDIDAVVIATPDHWHALQFVDACRAGKDVYVEKPMSLTIGEGRRMVEVAKETKRITQVGTQRRSAKVVQEAVELVRSGAIGHVTWAKCWHISNMCPHGIGNPPDCEPPAELDWDMWLGPAPLAKYNPNRCLYKFRWYRSYSGGQLTNMGTHYLDIIQWALGQDAPSSIVAMGGKYAIKDSREIPDTLEVVWEYPGGTLVTFSQTEVNAAPGNRSDSVEFRGTNGTLYLMGGGYEIVPEQHHKIASFPVDPLRRKENRDAYAQTTPACEAKQGRGQTSEVPHARDFLDCVKGRKPCVCPVEVGHRSTSATLLGNLAYDRKRRIDWDAKSERVTNDDMANDLLIYEYRKPWKLS